MKEFTNALENNNIKLLKSIKKSDHHNHATRGGNINDFIDPSKKLPKRDFKDLNDMQYWYETNIKCLFKGKEGLIKRIKSAFRQAVHDGVSNLTLSFGTGDKIFFDNSFEEYIQMIKNAKDEIAPEIQFIPEISFSRHSNINNCEYEFDEILEYNFFKSIDLVGDDTIPVNNFKKIYIKAKQNNFILKAHLGEFGDSSTIFDGIKTLDLDQIQHGNNAIHSIKTMNYIKDRDITLNLCPSSNLMLNRAKNYKDHPIKKLFMEGVKVTINSDDMLIFNQSVSDDYLNLYNHNCLSANDLNIIRETGLSNI